jgi:hypothetical protein
MNLDCCWLLKRARYGREGKKQTIFLQAFQLIKPRYHTGIETKVILQLTVLAGKKKTSKVMAAVIVDIKIWFSVVRKHFRISTDCPGKQEDELLHFVMRASNYCIHSSNKKIASAKW